MKKLFDGFVTASLVISALIVAGAVARREFFTTPGQSDAAALEIVSNWDTLKNRAIEQKDRNAQVQIVEFMDLECPFCREFNLTMHRLKRKFGDSVAVGFIHFPLENHSHAREAAHAAECAGKQGRFGPFVDSVYAKQAELGSKHWDDFAIAAAVADLTGFRACLASAQADSIVSAGVATAMSMHLNGTPTIIVNGWKFASPPSEAKLDTMIAAILVGKNPFPSARLSFFRTIFAAERGSR